MKYKLIVADVDGTLLNEYQSISRQTIKSINSARESGLLFTLATGRNHINTMRTARKVGVQTPVVCNDGALVIDLSTNKVIYEERIPPKCTKGVLDILNKFDFKYTIHFMNASVVNKSLHFPVSKLIKKYGLNLKMMLAAFQFSKEKKYFTQMNDEAIFAHINSNNDYPFKITVFDSEANPDRFEEAIREINDKYDEDIEISMVTSFGFELVPKDVSKAEGLKKLCQYLEVYPDQIVAFGDNYNDAAMIKFAGLGVAMGNAKEKIKFIADVITDSNNHNGIGKVIDKMILENK